jgi:signal peptidase I
MNAAYRKSTAREYFESVVVAVILALFARTFVFQAFKIPSGSMKPNLLVGDHLLVNRMIFAPTPSATERALLPVRAIRRGDIIVFTSPEDPDIDLVKRTIGLPGETVELRNQTVFVNGQALEEPYAHYLFPPSGEGESVALDVRRKYGPVTVPAGHYFMMGDNRDDSRDSRFWGFMPGSYVKGQALFIYWSFDTPDDGSSSGLATRWSRLFHQIH